MSEPHRVSFTTIGSSKKQSKAKPKSDTVRITINLTEPSGASCPVFSYTALANSVVRKKKKENEKQLNGSIDHIHDCDEDQLKKIAQQYENKYGTKENRFSNYKELGAGYDDNDSFIDNTEALDEALSEQMETEYGGYYVNVGPLQLKQLDGSENSDDEEFNLRTHNLKRAAKAIVSDSGEEESEGGEEEEEEREDEDSREDNQTASKENKSPAEKVENVMDVDEEKSDVLPNETDKFRNKSNGEIKTKKLKQKRRRDSSSVILVEKKKKKLSKSLTVKKLLEEKRTAEAPPGLSRNGDLNELCEEAIERSPPMLQVPSLSTSQMNLNNEDIVPLPHSLSPDILEVVNFMKQSANNCHSGKSKFFTNEINAKLLSLECKCRDGTNKIGPSLRHMIYTHLSYYLPCGKETLMKRAKKLLTVKEEEKLEILIAKLKTGINRIMPSLLEKHSEACQKASKEKYIDTSVSGCASSNSESKPKGSKVPRRVFPWDEELRSCVRQIIECRLRIFKLVKGRKDTVEEYLHSFVNSKLKPLWPIGWMKVSTILKVAELLPGSKPRKNAATGLYQKKNTSVVNNSCSNAPIPADPAPASTHVPDSKKSMIVSSSTPVVNSFKDKFKQSETSLPEIDMFSDPIDLLSKITSAILPNSAQQQTNSNSCIQQSPSPQRQNSIANLQTSPNSSTKVLDCKKPSSDSIISKNNNFNVDSLIDYSKKEMPSGNSNLNKSSVSSRPALQSYPKSSNDQVLDLSPVKSPVISQNHKSPATEGTKHVSLKHRILQESMKEQAAETESSLSLKESKPPRSESENADVNIGSLTGKDAAARNEIVKKRDVKKSVFDDIKDEAIKYKTEAELDAERCMIEETMTATDVLNQIINESLQDPGPPVVLDEIKPLYQKETMKPPPLSMKDDTALQERKSRSQSVEECEASMEAVIRNLQDLQAMSGNKVQNNSECKFTLPAGNESSKYINDSKSSKSEESSPVKEIIDSTTEPASIPKVNLGYQAEFFKHLLSDSTSKGKMSNLVTDVPDDYQSMEDNISKPLDPNKKNIDQNYYCHEPS